jgi:hypothetical protein
VVGGTTRLRPKEWGAHKKSGGYLFEQLPKATITFEDGSTFDLFQSLTIFRYLARKAGTLLLSSSLLSAIFLPLLSL